jgi:hypothetical protein
MVAPWRILAREVAVDFVSNVRRQGFPIQAVPECLSGEFLNRMNHL